MDNSNVWFLYIIRCKGGVLYTGITIDIQRRFKQHESGKGAKFLRGKAPLELVYQKKIGNQSEALKMEVHVKKLSKQKKEEMILAD